MCPTNWVFWKSWKRSKKMPMLQSCFSNVTLWLYQNRTPPWIFPKECSDFFRDPYLFGEPNNYFDTAAQRKLSKCNRRITVTVLRTLVKSPKRPKRNRHSPKVALLKDCPEKFHKPYRKELLMRTFLSSACHSLTTLTVFNNSYSHYPMEHWWTAVSGGSL